MALAALPIIVRTSPALREALGPALSAATHLALREVFRNRRSIEVAHQQIVCRRRHVAFSSRVGREGDLILDLDLGDPTLGGRVVLEEEFRDASRRIARIRDR